MITFLIYRQLKPIYEEYKKSRDKEKYLRGHESEIILFEAAARALKEIGDIRKYQLFVVDLLHISRPLSIFFTLSRAALSCFALSFAAARALRIEGFFSRFSFFAENS